MNIYLFRSGDPIINKINDLPNPPILNYTSYKYKKKFIKKTRANYNWIMQWIWLLLIYKSEEFHSIQIININKSFIACISKIGDCVILKRLIIN